MSTDNYYFIEIPSNVFSMASLWVKSGYANDPVDKEGLTHFFEHLFLTRTSTFSNKIEALRAIDGSGLFYNAHTGKDLMYFYFLQQQDHLDQAFRYLIEGVQSFDVNESDITRERDVIIEEQKKHRANPAVYLWSLADRGLWPRSALGRSGLGSESSIASITRADILGFKEIVFNEHNLGFLALSPAQPEANLERLLQNLRVGSGLGPGSPLRQEPEPGDPTKVIAEYRPSETIFVAFSFLLPGIQAISSDKVALNFIRNYLASGWSSRLVERLRLGKNYTYWVYGGFDAYLQGSYLRFSLSADKRYLKEIMMIILEEIEALKADLISEDVFAKQVTATKAHIMKHYIQPEDMLWWYGSNIFSSSKFETLRESLTNLNELTREKVREVARTYLDEDNMCVAGLGDVQETDLIVG